MSIRYDSGEDEFDEPDNSHHQAFNYKTNFSQRDLTLHLPKTTINSFQPVYDSPDSEDACTSRLVPVSVSLIALITENLLSHPFVVLRRQCQVHHNSLRFHLTPVTLIPAIFNLHKQGVCTLWKGIGSSLLVRGLSLAVEDALSKLPMGWPKEITSRTTVKQFGHHLILKSISLGIVMPFYAASLVETVQSGIASEKPGIFDVFREGSSRVLSMTPVKGRMLPVWVLICPWLVFGLSKYLFSVIVKGVSTRVISKQIHRQQEKKGAKPKDLTILNDEIELYSNIIALISSEILFYPFETIMHRLFLQGTRTIIDNLDTATAVVPILTSYTSASDCFLNTVSNEGYKGLYKGFGACLLQFAAHLAVIKLSKWIICQISEVCSDSKAPKQVTEFYNLEDPSRSLSYVSSLNDEP